MATTVKNSLTGKEITRPKPIYEEVPFDGGVMITETDLAGIITYANKKFIEMTGYSARELVGSPHNINRHPDMPKEAFRGLWETIKKGEYWEGYVRNMTKEGKHYDVIVWITAKKDEDDNIIGYIAGRKVPDKDIMAHTLRKYAKMKDAE